MQSGCNRQALRATARVTGLFALLAVGCPPPQIAPSSQAPPIFFWGIRRDCRRDALLSSVVEKRLGHLAGDTRRVWPVPTLENAKPEIAAIEFSRSCDVKSGILVGGHVEERPMGRGTPVTLMRLWRVDLASGRVSYRDQFCRGCDVTRILATQVAYLTEEGGPNSATDGLRIPSFCLEEVTPPAPTTATGDPQAVAAAGVERVLLSVQVPEAPRVDRKLRGQLIEALRGGLAQTGREALVVEVDRATGLPQGTQKGLLKGQARYAVHFEVDGAAASHPITLRVARAGEETQGIVFDCPGCDATALGTRLSTTLARMLDDLTPPAAAPRAFPVPADVRVALCSGKGAALPQCPGSDGHNLDSGPLPYPFAGALCGESIDVPLDPDHRDRN